MSLRRRTPADVEALGNLGNGTVPADNKDATGFEDRDTDDFTAEVAWLTKVAAAYRKLGKNSANPL